MSYRIAFTLCIAAVIACSGDEEKEKEKPAAEEKPAVSTEQVDSHTTKSGLKFELVQAGKAGSQPKRGERVRVHYTGRLTDGAKFDSSVDRGEPFEFTLGRGEVIRGWDEGIALMTEGAKAKLTVPPNLGYGARARRKIPAHSTLVFDVELIKVLRPPTFRKPDPAKAKKTDSGLTYEVLKEGSGAAPDKGNGVKLAFAVWNGQGNHVFSTEMNGAHLSGTVAGLQLTRLGEKFLEEAVALMKPGSKCVFEVPPELCWGDRQAGPNVPPNSVTVWELELVQVNEVPDFEAPVEANQKTTATGLRYEVLEEGTGPKPAATNMVTVNYAGWLTDGTLFDSSFARGEPTSFRLNQVIPGWTEGLQLMKVGARYRFTIPPDIGYGPRAAGKIPANSTLIFLVELLEVK